MGKGKDRDKEFLAFKKTLELLEARIKLELGSQGKSNDYIKQHLDKLWRIFHELETRTHDLEVQVNLITRLITVLSLENLGIDLRNFRRLIRRVEKELEVDTEVAHLESLFSLEPKDPAHKHKHIHRRANDKKGPRKDFPEKPSK